jgi:hypothetical protein
LASFEFDAVTQGVNCHSQRSHLPRYGLPHGFLPSAFCSAQSCRLAGALAAGEIPRAFIRNETSVIPESRSADDVTAGWCQNLAAATGRLSGLFLFAFLNPHIIIQIYVGAGRRDYVPVEERVAVEGSKKTPSPAVHSG